MPISLEDIDISAWTALETAASDPQSGFRYLNLCTVDTAGNPQARMVVLRRVDRLARILEFHTDTRSPKWQEIAAHPRVTVVGYGHQQKLQLRLEGTIKQYTFESQQASAAWRGLSARTRSTYAGGPPGDSLAFHAAADDASAQPLDDAEGLAHFGVLILHVNTLDWFQLSRENNQRAWLTYTDSGALHASKWINP
ncbi:pyridoxamine 5'-phosphate oxidase family protein [Rouxiella badensis]|uniref:pyridoxamine 5'-phosphate oxidase family protein n=1 Tax=Rouxiella badensis TaxID=1646377 RepID=UPI00301C6DCA